MKKVISIFISLCFVGLLQAQVAKTVNIATAGSLNSVLTSTELGSVENLTLTGSIDARDFVTMRDSMPKLSVIDLSGTNIVAYYGNYGTITGTTEYGANVIPNYAFYNELAFVGLLTLQKIILPTSATIVNDYAFYGCNSLKNVDYSASNSLSRIGNFAFGDCSNLRDFIIQPSVTSLGYDVFWSCTSLKSMTIPSSIDSIPFELFSLDTSLVSVIIPTSVKVIEYSAFSGCKNLKAIYSYPTKAINLTQNSNVFENVSKSTCILYVPVGSVSAYKAATVWKDFTNIREMGSFSVYDVDGNGYDTVRIGTQIWFKQNLKTTTYNDGTTIPNITDKSAWTSLTSGAVCIYSNSTNIDTINTYGRLYNWFTVNTGKLCPNGWHIPNDVEWTNLITYLTNNGFEYGGTGSGNGIAKSIAATSGWYSFSTLASIGHDIASNNSSGFTAQPGGRRDTYGGMYIYIGQKAYWWSITQSSATNANTWEVSYDDGRLLKTYYDKHNGFSVRCLKDENIPTTLYQMPMQNTAGALATLFPQSVKDTITYVALTGTIDARDFKTMRDSMPNLANIDLSGATIVAYTGTNGTSSSTNVTYNANTIPQLAFYSNIAQGNTILTKIIAPTSTTTVADSVFMYCTSLSEIVLPASVTSLGIRAFAGCESLTLFQFPNAVASIGDYVLGGCINLETVNVSSSVSEISDYAFASCSKISSFTFSMPSAVTRIGNSAFAGCGIGLNLIIPNSVTTIDYAAFQGAGLKSVLFENASKLLSIGLTAFNASTIESITFPSKLTVIDKFAFQGCSKLKTVLFENQSSLTTIGNYAFNLCKLTSIDIPATVDSIGSSAFANCTTLQSIYVNSLTPVDLTYSPNTFYAVDKSNCKLFVREGTLNAYKAANQWKDFLSMQEIVIVTSKTLTNIAGSLAFSLTQLEKQTITSLTLTGTIDARDFKTMRDSMPNLANIDLSGATIVAYTGTEGPKNKVNTTYLANTIPHNSFYIDPLGDTVLKSFVFPVSTTDVGDSAFGMCFNVKSMNLPSNLKTIGACSFVSCQSMTNFTLPNTLTTIGYMAFGGCYALQSIVIPNSVTSIGEAAFVSDTSLTTATLPNSISSIPNLMFHSSGLTSISIPQNIKYIGVQAFTFNKNLVSVTLDNSSKLLKIDSMAFWCCFKLKSIDIPISVTSIGKYAFQTCSSLQSIYVHKSLPIDLSNSYNVFENVPTATCILYVPNGSANAYKAANQWKDFNLIQEISSLTLSTQNLSISGNASSTSVDVTSNGSWLATSDQSWLTVTPVALTNGDGKINLSATANNDGVTRVATITVSGVGLTPQTITVTQPITTAAPYLALSTNSVNLNKVQNNTANVFVTSNVQWSALSNQSWLTFLPTTPTSGNAALTVFATPNKTITNRTGLIIISATGVNPQTITVYQSADSFVVKKQIPDITIDVNAVSKKFLFADYISYYGTSKLTFTIESDNIGVATAAVSYDGFGLIQYGKGTANLTIRAESEFGASISMTFVVNVTSSAPATNCNSFSVFQNTTNIKCHGESTGSIELNAIGGVPPYNYKWSNTHSGNQIINVPAGSYSVVITDSNACTLVKTYEITEPTELTASVSKTEPTCSASDGTITLNVSGGNGTYSYVWDNGSKLATVTSLASGVYSVTITDKNVCTLVQSIDLNNAGAPKLQVDSIISSDCKTKTGKIALSTKGGKGHISFKWNDSETKQNRIQMLPGNYFVTVTDSLGCNAALKIEIPTKSITEPKISLVTVSEFTGKNLVVWLKDSNDFIDKYKIYRETTKAGEYKAIDSIQYADTSIYVDEDADPQKNSWRYKLSAHDNCGHEHICTTEFKTMNLQQSVGLNNKVNLVWDEYEGSDYYTYSVYRQTAKGVKKIDSLPASVNRYTDPNPPTDVKSYYVTIDLPQEIDPLGKRKLKADSGPFSISLSNMAESQLTFTSTGTSNKIQISPNPTTNSATISVSSYEAITVQVYDIMGNTKLLQSGNGSIKIDCSTFAKGMYLVKVRTENAVVSKTLIVE